MRKIILLNGGKATRQSFTSGLQHTPLESYRTKETILHIKNGKDLHFINHNNAIDFTDSTVFTRLRSHDELFTGIIYEHLATYNISASDVINASFMMSGEKIAQMPRLARANITIPQSIIAREESYEANRTYIEQQLSFPLVYKTDGNRGEAVFLIETNAELEQKIADKNPKELFLLQEVIPNTFDTRTLVAYGQILGTIKRTAPPNTFHNNVSRGATVTNYELTAEEKIVAIKATAASLLDFGGVDIIHTDNGPVVLEVNKAPQIEGFESVYGTQTVFKRIAQIIEQGDLAS